MVGLMREAMALKNQKKPKEKFSVFFLPLYFGVDHPPVVLADLDDRLPGVVVVTHLL